MRMVNLNCQCVVERRSSLAGAIPDQILLLKLNGYRSFIESKFLKSQRYFCNFLVD